MGYELHALEFYKVSMQGANNHGNLDFDIMNNTKPTKKCVKCKTSYPVEEYRTRTRRGVFETYRICTPCFNETVFKGGRPKNADKSALYEYGFMSTKEGKSLFRKFVYGATNVLSRKNYKLQDY